MNRALVAMLATALACAVAWAAWGAAGWLLPWVGLEDFDLLARGGGVIVALGLMERLFACLAHALGTDT